MSQLSSLIGVDFEVIQQTVSEILGTQVKEVDFIGKNKHCKIIGIKLLDGVEVILRLQLKSLPSYVMETEVATMRYLTTKTTIPVPRILHFNFDHDHPLGVYMLSEKFEGIKLSTIFSSLSAKEQDFLVKQIAHWSIELFKHRFDTIGSLYIKEEHDNLEFIVGPISHPLFYGEDRGNLSLNRGPFHSSRAYFKACQQRELDYARTQCPQDTSDTYQQNVADVRLTVERCMSLLGRVIERCRGLDEDDPTFNEFSLSMAELDLGGIYVAPDAPSLILPTWLTHSLSDSEESQSLCRERLTTIFRKSIQSIDGPDSLFLKALDMEQTRQTIDHICDYNAFTDGFLLLPTLESLIATLPGEEDIEGLQELLNPHTLEGRAARIALLTKGTHPLSLASEGLLDNIVAY
ncbi:hypothetical protein Clacol_002795 [Clathrus columnatus]|uniref:Aminoglycoside phosphotransferase domain-containing protein n=1 Tax=Clathrus columnatus TaxID=1419009 RepID=A0AAV5A6E6_9AGAM|nr:hypothetical protein Clacol_002795 [Clathrus columnatus]